MQIELFESVKSPNGMSYGAGTNHIVDWQSILVNKMELKKQVDLVSMVSSNNEIMVYKSGASNKSDLLGYISANSNIGVCIMDTSLPVRNILCEYASNGGKCFLDSGAYRVFMAKLKDKGAREVNFDVVFERYHQVLARCTSPSNLIVVAPDVVGSQSRSFELLQRYAYEVKLMNKLGAKVMIPLQKGELSISEYYQSCLALLGFDFTVGLPSNAEALSKNEVISFINKIKPNNVHFLGCSEKEVIHMASYKSSSTKFSCDATQLRKHLGKGQLLTEMHHQILDDSVQSAIQGRPIAELGINSEWDETDFLGYLAEEVDNFSKPQLRRFASMLNCSEKDILVANMTGELWSFLDERNYGYAYDLVKRYFFEQCHKAISPKVRTNVISTLAQAQII